MKVNQLFNCIRIASFFKMLNFPELTISLETPVLASKELKFPILEGEELEEFLNYNISLSYKIIICIIIIFIIIN